VDFKNNDLQPIHFDRGDGAPYYTRPMAGGPPDLVDCLRLAESAATLERVYELRDLPRLQDVLTDPQGHLQVSFAFGKTESGRAGATVAIQATPMLQCQRCLEGFAFPVKARSEIEFADQEFAGADSAEREPYVLTGGSASLRDLAEEELLLALPVAPACSAPEKCGKAPQYEDGARVAAPAQAMVRPFSALQDLLKKP
jgi:uncharacterized protein